MSVVGEPPLAKRGDRLTCSSARDCKSMGYSLTHPILGPVPVLHLQDMRLAKLYSSLFSLLLRVSDGTTSSHAAVPSS